MLLGVQTFHVLKAVQKIHKNSKILKNDGHFQIPHPNIGWGGGVGILLAVGEPGMVIFKFPTIILVLNSFQTFAKM